MGLLIWRENLFCRQAQLNMVQHSFPFSSTESHPAAGCRASGSGRTAAASAAAAAAAALHINLVTWRRLCLVPQSSDDPLTTP